MDGGLGAGDVLLGKYRIHGMLGRGGMGVVLKATHLHLGDDLAVKVLSREAAASPEVHARFRWEAQSVLRLRGEHVTRVLDVGLLPDGAPYMVTEFLRGPDLAHELERRGQLVPGEAVDYVLQACEALAEAHANGVVHQNVKPGNLFLIARPDGRPLVKVTDFGISKALLAHEPFSSTSTLAPGYLSPEQLQASMGIDARTDIWALGAVLYECLTGRRPFKSGVAMAMGEAPPAMDPRIRPELAAVVMRCLETDRNARFPSIAALAAALAPFAHDQRAAALVLDGVNRGPRVADSQPRAVPAVVSSLGLGLGRGAGALQRSFRHRAVALGVIAMLAVVVVLLAVVLAASRGPDDAGSARAGDGSGAPDRASPVVAAKVVAPADAGPSTGERLQQLATCTSLLDERNWQALELCASELDKLGVNDQANVFHATASQEALNEAEDAKLRKALRDGDLKAAEASLGLITADSVYFAAVSDAFAKAESRAIDEARSKAQHLAGANDCTALRRFVSQLAGSSSDRVVAAASVRCADKDAPDPPARPATAEVATRPGAPANAEPPRPPPAAEPHKGCDKVNADDLMIQAATQYDAGNAKSALSLAAVALHCKQSPRMYWLAVLYACSARDVASAKQYFREVPANLQPGIERKCQQDSLDVRSR